MCYVITRAIHGTQTPLALPDRVIRNDYRSSSCGTGDGAELYLMPSYLYVRKFQKRMEGTHFRTYVVVRDTYLYLVLIVNTLAHARD